MYLLTNQSIGWGRSQMHWHGLIMHPHWKNTCHSSIFLLPNPSTCSRSNIVLRNIADLDEFVVIMIVSSHDHSIPLSKATWSERRLFTSWWYIESGNLLRISLHCHGHYAGQWRMIWCTNQDYGTLSCQQKRAFPTYPSF